jgi:hypothetical protein
LKYAVVIDSNLGGAGIWALGYDGTKTELWGALRDAFYYTGIKEPSGSIGPIAVFPNPAKGKVYLRYQQGRHETQLTIDFFDGAGRRVNHFSISARYPAPVMLTWDGKDSQGNALPSGKYFYILHSNMHTLKGSILFLR